MTQAPKRIWRVKPWLDSQQQHGLASWPVEEHAGPEAVEYHRADFSADLVRAAFLAGFNASGEGWNGEYPFRDHGIDPASDEYFIRLMDEAIDAIVAQVMGEK
jgi:hypothetical protein